MRGVLASLLKKLVRRFHVIEPSCGSLLLGCYLDCLYFFKFSFCFLDNFHSNDDISNIRWSGGKSFKLQARARGPQGRRLPTGKTKVRTKNSVLKVQSHVII